ncbi:orotate phosphoribosyltransferase [Ruminococcaceae bacterium OttesenSCG-928-D13]|nr:orotate phosphoribosyltransferase [Ruminococcaceae bacterium OttesenSCG-928-D13]
MEITAATIAKDLLSIGAVFLRPNDPFTWASGIKSPIYCDNRLTLSVPAVRRHVEAGLAEIIRREYPDCQVVAGTATAGIAHAALVAELLDLPMCYVRASAKDHGRNNQIEGSAKPGQKVVVVEDLISTAGSVIEVVGVLREAGCEVLGIASIFTYGLAAGLEKLAAAQVKNVSLSNYDALAEVALAEGAIKESDLPKLRAFRENPRDAGWMAL